MVSFANLVDVRPEIQKHECQIDMTFTHCVKKWSKSSLITHKSCITRKLLSTGLKFPLWGIRCTRE